MRNPFFLAATQPGIVQLVGSTQVARATVMDSDMANGS